MQEEIVVVIDLIKETYNINKNKEAFIIYTEPGVMYTLQLDRDIYKSLNVNDEWKITLMK